MRNYEVTFIVNPVLSGDEVKAIAQKYVDMLVADGAKIVHIDEIGLQQLAYLIEKRHSGVYYCVEFQAADGTFVNKFELALKRDENILRYLTVSLDKFGVKYNEDKRAGKIGKRVNTPKNKPAAASAPVPAAATNEETTEVVAGIDPELDKIIE